MEKQDYTISIAVNATAQQTFNGINSITKWWTEDMQGSSAKLDDVFTVRFGDIHYSEQKLVEVVPGKKLVWLVTGSRLNFLKDKQEWTNTKISFEIVSQNSETNIHFMHIGLTPAVECYNVCIKGWDQYIKGSLFKLLTEGKGMPWLK